MIIEIVNLLFRQQGTISSLKNSQLGAGKGILVYRPAIRRRVDAPKAPGEGRVPRRRWNIELAGKRLVMKYNHIRTDVTGDAKMNKDVSVAVIVLACILSLILHTYPAVAQESQSHALRVNGAAIASDVVQRWADSFTQSHPDMRVMVTGSSAGKGFETLFGKQADIALASRLISESEQKTADGKGLKLADRPIGYAGVAVYTTPRNPVNELTTDQLAQIFSGKLDNWKLVGGPDEPIRCLSRRMPESGAVVFFWETILNKAPLGKNTVFAENWSTILKACAGAQDFPIGIGPVPLGENKSGAKILAIKRDENSPAVMPSPSSLKDKSYPIALLFRFYWDSQTTDKRVIPFVDYCEKIGLGQN